MAVALAVLARAELAARGLNDATVVDCVRSCTKHVAGQKLTRRVLSATLWRLYRIKPTHVQLNAAVAVVYQGKVGGGRMNRYEDRRQGFDGLAIAAEPASPTSVYRVWDRMLNERGLKVGQIQQIVDVWKVARGEQATNKALDYLHDNEWLKWPELDRAVFEGWYVEGKTIRRLAKELGRPNAAIWARLSVHQARAGVSPSQGIGAGPSAPEVAVTASPQPAFFRREGVQLEPSENERIGGFTVQAESVFVDNARGAGRGWLR